MPAALGTDLKGQSNLAGDANAGQREHAPFAAHCESLPDRTWYRSRTGRTSSVRAFLYVSLP